MDHLTGTHPWMAPFFISLSEGAHPHLANWNGFSFLTIEWKPEHFGLSLYEDKGVGHTTCDLILGASGCVFSPYRFFLTG